jgi:hypothetical protein
MEERLDLVNTDSTPLAEAIRLALSILEPFEHSSLYSDYQAADDWADDDFVEALRVLKVAEAGGYVEPQDCLIVDGGLAQLGPKAGLSR